MPKLISEPMVRLAQTVHLSCVETNTFSKLTKTCLHLTHVTYEFHRVRPKMTSEPIACSAQTVHLSCIETNTISKRTETSLPLTHVPRSAIGYGQNDFHAHGTFGANHALIMH